MTVMIGADENQRLTRMIRETMQRVRESEALLEQTKKIISQSRALPRVTVKRTDDRITQT